MATQIHTALRLFIAYCLLVHQAYAHWRPKRLESCELHPDIELRIQRDVAFWGDVGISEQAALSVCKFCDLPATQFKKAAHQDNAADALQPWRHHRHHRRRLRRVSTSNSRTLDSERYLISPRTTPSERPASDDEQLRGPLRQPTQDEEGRTAGLQSGSQGRAQGVAPGRRGLRGEARDCNKPQRVLIQNGTVYLTSLVAADVLGPFEHIGFLVELYEASQVYRLPDVEFTYWFGDNAPAHTRIAPDGSSEWPYGGGVPAVLAWSKWNENSALLVPYSGAFRCAPDSWDVLESQLETLAAVPWNDRKEVAFGRWNAFCTHYIPWSKTADGQVMKCPRTHLPQLAAAHPELLDTRELGQARSVPLAHQNSFKYIVSTDGWSISSKFDKYLLLGSAVFKANSTRYGFYYDAIKPYTHYVPFMVESSDDILEAVSWAKSHDVEARQVAEQGRRFALRHLNRPARLCYLFRLLTELSKKMRYRPDCERRQLCVPLVRELRFLKSYGRTEKSCRYEEVLLRYGDDDPDDFDPDSSNVAEQHQRRQGNRAYSLGDLQQLHESGVAWPRDDLLLPRRQR